MATPNGVTVTVAADGREAVLTAAPGLDGAALDVDATRGLVERAGAVVDASVLEALRDCAVSYGNGERELIRIIARATPPTPGTDGSFEWLEGFDPQAPLSPASEDGRVDHFAGRAYRRVTVGTVVAALRPPTRGVDGRDVRGCPIEARPGRPAPILLHESLAVDADGRVTVQVDGVLLLRGGELRVTRELVIHDGVDFATGRIDFGGNVTIEGDIRAGFHVKAGGDLVVRGTIEPAQIECTGDLVAEGGMAGDGRGAVSVGADARVSYLEGVSGSIAGDLHVHRELVQCRLVVGGSLRAHAGTIVGGEISVAGSLSARALGSRGCVPTTLVLVDAPRLGMARDELLRALAHLGGKLAGLSATERELRRATRPTPHDREHLTELGHAIRVVTEDLRRHEERLREIDAALAGRRPIDVSVTKIIHPEVRLRVGRHEAVFRVAATGPLRIGWDDGGALAYRREGSTTRPITEIARLGTLPRAA